MAKPGFIISAHLGQRRQVVELAVELERRGFPFVLCPHDYSPILNAKGAQPPPYDALSLCTAVIQATHTIKVGSDIAVTYTRHPAEMAAAASFNHELSEDRFILGLGPGHNGILQRYKIPTEKPLSHMKNYTAQVRAAFADWSQPPIIWATLRKKMTTLTGQEADGLLANNWALSQVREQLRVLPPERQSGDYIRGAIVPAFVGDRSEGLAAIRNVLSFYTTMQNYVEYYHQAGFGESAEAAKAAMAAGDRDAARAAIPDAMADEMGIVGTAAQVRERAEAWQAAGINWLALSSLQSSGSQYDNILQIARAWD